ncbi:hypothetical protein CRUP_035217, partial [Coryphaenoides rupestris]
QQSSEEEEERGAARSCSAPSWWEEQKELGHSWQKASEAFPHTSQWCQGQSQRPAISSWPPSPHRKHSSSERLPSLLLFLFFPLFTFTSKGAALATCTQQHHHIPAQYYQ